MDEPTEQELEQRKKEIQSRWTPAQEEARRSMTGRVEWSLPQYYIEYRAAHPGSPCGRRNKRVKIYRPLP